MSIPDYNIKALTAFASVAGEFCEFIESLRSTRPAHMYASLESLLARLHLAILPVETETPEEKHPEYRSMKTTTDEEGRLREALTAVFAKEVDDLRQWHESLKTPDDVESAGDAYRAACFSNDIAELYSDIQYGLTLWRLGVPDAQAEAAWEWRWGYEHHWGDHMLRAMTTVHEARRFLYAD